MTIVRVGATVDVQTEAELRAKLTRWSQTDDPGWSQAWRPSAEEIEAEVAERRRYVDVVIHEFAELSDLTRIVSEETRGGTSALHPEVPDPWKEETPESIFDFARQILEADGETGIERWGMLLRTLERRGVEVTAERLDELPCHIELSDRLWERLSNAP
jgi:hypothetical protein